MRESSELVVALEDKVLVLERDGLQLLQTFRQLTLARLDAVIIYFGKKKIFLPRVSMSTQLDNSHRRLFLLQMKLSVHIDIIEKNQKRKL